MKVSRQEDGRSNQKARTRAALVDAAAKLLSQNVSPTVGEAAEAAKISRATAYRYFPTQESLLLEISTISPTFAPVDEAVETISDPDPEKRLGALLKVMNQATFENEAQVRTALKIYMDQWIESRRRGELKPPVLRVGRRMIYLDKILGSLRTQLPHTQWQQLRNALALTMGPEALVAMKDVCGLSDRDALNILSWTANAILRAALSDIRT